MGRFSKRTFQLSVKKRELLESLLKAEGVNLSATQKISRRKETDFLPLSFAQQRLWFLNQLEPDSPFYNAPIALRLSGPLQVAVLEQSINEIIRRHEALRTIFATVDGRPIQIIAPHLKLTLSITNLSHLPESEREAQALQLVMENARLPFDLAHGPLVRASLLQLSEEEHVLLLATHHIVSDGWSTGVLYRELGVLYLAFSRGQRSPLAELPIQYADYAVWQREWLQGEVLEKQLSYWKEQLANAPAVLELPTDRPHPVVQSYQGAKQRLTLSKNVTEGLKRLIKVEGTTLFMTLLAAFQTLVMRYTSQDDIVVGTPIAGRGQAETEELIGFFVNTLALRTDLSGDPSFRELLGRVKEVTLGAYTHQDVPFEKLVEELQPERTLSRTPLFQVMFALHNLPEQASELSGLRLSGLPLDIGKSQFDLSLFMFEGAEGLSCVLEYSTDLFDTSTLTRMLGHFECLLEGIVTDPDQRLSQLPLLTAAERQQLLVEWNNTQSNYPKDKCIHELFEAQVEKTPDAIALIVEDKRLTYRELNQRANQVAQHLRARGVKPEVRVGVLMERSAEMVVGVLGILKAGGAYVPLDPAYPQERLRFMLEDAQVPMLVTQERLVESLPRHAAEVLCVDRDWEVIARESADNPASWMSAENLAYVIYTSGSTGSPKGVAIEHHSTVTLLHWARDIFSLKQLAGVLASTSICFDLSVFELFVPLSWGGTIILAENALQLPTLPAAEQVTLINTVPSAIAELVRIGGVPASVHTVNLAGEPLQTLLVQEIYRQDTIQQVFDLYGPSEDTTYSTFTLRSATGRATIGRPIACTEIYILDRRLNPVPIGVPGELYIGGDGLARGYLNRPDLTTEKFIRHPFSQEPNARLYRTGDLARYLPDGNIEYLGRLDHQVKIRGFRIELGEVEAVLAGHGAVREAVVLAREDVPGDKRLVAYVVAAQDQLAPSTGELRSYLKQKLPEYMVPGVFVTLDVLPLTPNGKVDRRALPAPDQARPELEGSYLAPRNSVEEVVAGIWADVLKLERVGIYDNFFELGGHSLLATQVISRLRDSLQVELPLRSLFGNPTVAGMSLDVEEIFMREVEELTEDEAYRLAE